MSKISHISETHALIQVSLYLWTNEKISLRTDGSGSLIILG